MKLSYLGNDKYKLIKYLIDNSYKQDGELFYKGNQQDTADNVHFSKQKTNLLMQELARNGFIELIDKYRSIYKINKVSVAGVKAMDKEI